MYQFICLFNQLFVSVSWWTRDLYLQNRMYLPGTCSKAILSDELYPDTCTSCFESRQKELHWTKRGLCDSPWAKIPRCAHFKCHFSDHSVVPQFLFCMSPPANKKNCSILIACRQEKIQRKIAEGAEDSDLMKCQVINLNVIICGSKDKIL